MKLGSTVPVLRIFDEDKAREFYVGFLGFAVDWEHRFGDNFPLYVQVSRDGCLLHLSAHHGDCCPGGAVRIATEGVEALAESLRAKQYRFASPSCRTTEWQTVEMSIHDPFGNRLLFVERAESVRIHPESSQGVEA